MSPSLSQTNGFLKQRLGCTELVDEQNDLQKLALWAAPQVHPSQKAPRGTPTLVEAVCYRFRGHSVSDPATYRTRDEVDQARTKDPIKVVRAIMEARGIADADWFKQTDKEVKEVVAEAVAFADESPLPPEEWIWEDVLVEDEV